MVDICTLVVITTTTAQACYSENICHSSIDGTKQICSGIHQISCPGFYGPVYDCKKPDGTVYTLTGQDAMKEMMNAPMLREFK